jgi:hypothetical protein
MYASFRAHMCVQMAHADDPWHKYMRQRWRCRCFPLYRSKKHAFAIVNAFWKEMTDKRRYLAAVRGADRYLGRRGRISAS